MMMSESDSFGVDSGLKLSVTWLSDPMPTNPASYDYDPGHQGNLTEQPLNAITTVRV